MFEYEFCLPNTDSGQFICGFKQLCKQECMQEVKFKMSSSNHEDSVQPANLFNDKVSQNIIWILSTQNQHWSDCINLQADLSYQRSRMSFPITLVGGLEPMIAFAPLVLWLPLVICFAFRCCLIVVENDPQVLGNNADMQKTFATVCMFQMDTSQTEFWTRMDTALS